MQVDTTHVESRTPKGVCSMNTRPFASLTRRRSLAAFGGAALAAAVSQAQIAQAGKAGKTAKKRVKRTCQRQDGQCAAFFEDLCEVDECEPEAIDAALACCAILRSCDAGAFMACMFEVLTGGEPE
jgi:hypothetical protein